MKKIRKTWFFIFILIVYLLLWVNQTVRSVQLSYQIQSVEQSISDAQEIQTQLKIKKDQLVSLKNVEKKAKEELGMISPKSKNIVILKVEKNKP